MNGDPKKPIVIRNNGKKKKKAPVVIVGEDMGTNVPYSLSVKQTMSFYIQKFNLKCSLSHFEYRVNWHELCAFHKMKEEFIKAFAHRVDWKIVSARQKLSSGFIKKFKDKVDWEMISKFQDLSKKFILRNLDKLHIDILIERGLISKEEIQKYKEEQNQKKIDKAKKAEDITTRFDIMEF